MKFIGREEELFKLTKEIQKEELTFSLIYGRRRVGKSELVKQALKNFNGKAIYYQCKEVSQSGNAESLGEIVSEVCQLPKLGYQSIELLLEYIFKASEKEKIVLVLDEYPYLRQSTKGMDSILQSLIDKYQDNAKIAIVLLGSYVEIMKSLIDYDSPLYGRTSLVINLKQMNYYESSLFYPNYSAEDKVKIYSVFGGIPYYNRLIDDQLTIKENIIELIASCGAKLENEIPMYLNAEISKITNANEVFAALAKGFCKYNDILSQSHVSSGPTMVDVLDKLMRMEVVEKENPINDENSRKKASYRICDNLSLFYYRYIFSHLSQMKIMDSDSFYDKYILDDFENDFVPRQFETICRQYLIQQNKTGKIKPVLEKIGKYYYDDPVLHKNGEFDVVSQDEDGYIFYEVKFRNKPITGPVIENEIQQVRQTGLDCERFVFISRSGFNCQKRKDTTLIELEELYSL